MNVIRNAYVLVRLQCLEGATEGAGNYITVVSWADGDGELQAVPPPAWPFANERECYAPTGEIMELKDVWP